MADKNLTYWDYVKAAFKHRTPLPLLGQFPVNQLILAGFGILGLGHPGFWLLGAGFETAYLVLKSSSDRFQKLVRGRQLLATQQSWDEKKREMLNRLDPDSRTRYLRLAHQCSQVIATENSSALVSDISGFKSEGLNQLLMIFLKLLTMQMRILETISRTKEDEIREDISKLETAIAAEAEGSPVQRAMRGTLDIQKTRLENLTRSAENLRFTETELDRIEKQVSLISEEAAVSRTPEQWSSTLDGVVKSLQGTSKWMMENSAVFEAMEAPPPSRLSIIPPPVPRTPQ